MKQAGERLEGDPYAAARRFGFVIASQDEAGSGTLSQHPQT